MKHVKLHVRSWKCKDCKSINKTENFYEYKCGDYIICPICSQTLLIVTMTIKEIQE
jgi:hypothetical protein